MALPIGAILGAVNNFTQPPGGGSNAETATAQAEAEAAKARAEGNTNTAFFAVVAVVVLGAMITMALIFKK